MARRWADRFSWSQYDGSIHWLDARTTKPVYKLLTELDPERTTPDDIAAVLAAHGFPDDLFDELTRKQMSCDECGLVFPAVARIVWDDGEYPTVYFTFCAGCLRKAADALDKETIKWSSVS
jgi:hypothetical protein